MRDEQEFLPKIKTIAQNHTELKYVDVYGIYKLHKSYKDYLTWLDSRSYFFRHRAFTVLYIINVALFFLIPFIFTNHFQLKFETLDWFYVFGLSIVWLIVIIFAYAIMIMILVFTGVDITNLTKNKFLLFLVTLTPTMFSVYMLIQLYQNLAFLTFNILLSYSSFIALTIHSWFMISFIISAYLSGVILRNVINTDTGRGMNARIITTLVEILFIMDDEKSFLIENEKKKLVIDKIFRLSTLFQIYPKKVFRFKNELLYDWSNNRFYAIASCLEDKVKWILLPQDTTFKDLISYFSSLLKNTYSGKLHFIPIKSDVSELKKEKRNQQKANILKVISALLPLILITVIGYFSNIEGDFYYYLLFGSGIWALISVLFVLDPDFAEKMVILKDASQLMKRK